MEIFDDSLTRVRHDKVERNKNKEAQRLVRENEENNFISSIKCKKYPLSRRNCIRKEKKIKGREIYFQ